MDKKLLNWAVALTVAFGAPLTSCSDDHDDLWHSIDNLDNRVKALEKMVNDANSDIAAIQTIVTALQQQVTVTAVTETADGYTIKFSDGKTATISNGRDGTNAPTIGLKAGDDSLYYWTLNGELMLIDGKPVCATGPKGEAGLPALTPQIRINPTNKEWEISTDGGTTWQSTGVIANGTDGDSFFRSVNTSDPSFVVFTLADGTEIKLARYDETAPMFAIKDCEGVQQFAPGESRTFNVETRNVADFSIAKPDGWGVAYSENAIKITAPTAENPYAETSGTVAVNVVSQSGKAVIAKVSVQTYRLRILTFEDADTKFTPFTLDYCNTTVSKWSDLIDSKQYGGPMLYGDSGMGMETPYEWADENNTFLAHTMPMTYGSYCYWSGGHAIPNYADTDLKHGDFSHQLSVYGDGGHNGSANFAMHYGYIDGSSFNMTEHLPALEFSDGKARVIDHMWVMNSTYAMNCYVSGNGLTAKIGPDDWVQLIATGYDSADTKTGETKFYMCNGPDNIVRDWAKWDLSSLGEVAKVEFNVTGSSDNGYGFSQPAYFAYDDVAVRFTE